MKHKEVVAYLEFAKIVANMSYARRLKVGAVIAKEDGDIISYGYNGTPKGFDNNCEYEVIKPLDLRGISVTGDGVTVSGFGDRELKTRKEVIHAELNAILKAAREGKSCKGAWLFLTHKPCDDCLKHIVQSGIVRVIYLEDYASASHGNSSGNDLCYHGNVAIAKWEL